MNRYKTIVLWVLLFLLIVVQLVITAVDISESAYMNGQIDALTGDIRIERDGSGWVWIKSPWDNERTTLGDSGDDLTVYDEMEAKND